MKNKNIIISTISILFFVFMFLFSSTPIPSVRAAYENNCPPGYDKWFQAPSSEWRCTFHCCSGADGDGKPRANTTKGECDTYLDSCTQPPSSWYVTPMNCKQGPGCNCQDHEKGYPFPDPDDDLHCCSQYYRLCKPLTAPPPPPPPSTSCGDNIIQPGAPRNEECDPPNSSCNYDGKTGTCTSSCKCCVRCSVSCIPPSTSTSNEWWLYEPTCNDRSVCPNPQNRSIDCYEVPSPQPDPNFLVHPELLKTTYGFTSTTYSGGGKYVDDDDDRVNDFMPLPQPDGDQNKFYMKASYKDGDQKIEAAYVWFSQSGSNPVTPMFINLSGNRDKPHTTGENTQFGFMLHINDQNWTPYIPAILGDVGNGMNDTWNKIQMDAQGIFPIKGPQTSPTTAGEDMVYVHIQKVTISPEGKEVDIEFSLSVTQKNNPERLLNRPPEGGKYNVFLMANDVFGFTPFDNYDDNATLQTAIRNKYLTGDRIRFYDQWVNRGWEWNIDLESPNVQNWKIESAGGNSKTVVNVSWDFIDKIGFSSLVLNIFKSPELIVPTPLSINGTPDYNGATLTNVDSRFPFAPPDNPVSYEDNNVGHLDHNINPYAIKVVGGGGSLSLPIDLGNIGDGFLYFVVTAFDKGGNVASGGSATLDTRNWLVTYGGLFFSDEGYDFPIRPGSTGLWTSIPLLNNIEAEKADITSELFGQRVNVTLPTPPVKSSYLDSYMIGPYDVKDWGSYYNELKTQFDYRKSGLSLEILPENSDTLSGILDSEKITLLDRTGNLTINSELRCNTRGIIFVDGDLIIDANILNQNPNVDACIFIVSGEVVLDKGIYVSSGTNIAYDELNAYILADKKIVLSEELQNVTTVDGLFLGGGIHSLTGIQMDRHLKLVDRLIYPTYVIDHHSKYGVFARELFGSQVEIQKTIVGVK